MAKLIQILTGFVFVQIAAALALALLFFALMPEGSFELMGQTWDAVHVTDSTAAWMVVMAVPIGFFEVGMYWLVEGLRMGGIGEAYAKSDFWYTVVKALQVLGLLTSAAAVLGLTALLGLEAYAIGSLWMDVGARPGNAVIGLLAAAGLYLLVRIPLAGLWWLLGKRILRWLRRGEATYRLVTGGVEIDLGMVKPSRQGPARFRVGFDELEDLRAFSYAEADTFLRFCIGPNASLSVRQTQDLYRFYRNEIPRPSVYLISGGNSSGVNVLMRGPGLLYLISFDADDAGDLVQAFEAQRKRSRR